MKSCVLCTFSLTASSPHATKIVECRRMIEPGLYRNVHEDDLNIWTASFSRVLDSVKTDELMIVLSVCDGDQQSSVVVATRTGVVGHVVMDVWEYFVERVEL